MADPFDMKKDDHIVSGSVDLSDDDDRELVALGYVPSFKREFSNLATVSFCRIVQSTVCSDAPGFQISFAFSIMVGVV